MFICFRSEFVISSILLGNYVAASWHLFLPSVLLSLQVYLNRKFLWALILVYISTYSLWVIWNVIELDVLIDLQRDYSPQPFWNLEKIGNWLTISVVLFVVNWIAWNLEPNKK
ncbi:hypothetical protein [Winogradskyella sp.]|uniref:hypothetical protein n=1 Tax=Winogradskyella sp. TaxID=1883156 RepID=UPI003F6D51BE